MGKPSIPNWLRVLPSGLYTLTELEKIAKKQKSSIVRTMKRLEIKKHYLVSNSNFSEVTYEWEGIDK